MHLSTVSIHFLTFIPGELASFNRVMSDRRVSSIDAVVTLDQINLSSKVIMNSRIRILDLMLALCVEASAQKTYTL